jgi:hypothetical protein
VEYGHASFLIMGTATMPAAVEQVTTPTEPAPDAQTFYRRRPPETIFSPDQQKVFDKAFTKRMAKERREFEAERSALRRDVKELLWACEQLLFKSLTPQQRQDFAGVVIEMRREYGPEEETACQKT